MSWPNGPLNRPKLPGIPASRASRATRFHTSRWDYDYTGGDRDGRSDGLADKRVGIIGTGATAVQCVPHLGESAKQLYVFQRTPSSIDVRANRPTDPEWARVARRRAGSSERMDNFNILVSGGVRGRGPGQGRLDRHHRQTCCVAMRQRKQPATSTPKRLAQMMELADFEKMEQIRARVDADRRRTRATAEALKPWYSQFCKRPCFHDEYLDTFNRPNVTWSTPTGRGVERITENGVVVDGVEYELDCLIYASGFEVGTDYTRRSGYEVYGRDGVSLSEKWADGVTTLHGFYSRGFPNCFLI